MVTKKNVKRTVLVIMVICIAMTATPLAFFGNKLEPLIFGIPYFFLWCMFWPTMVFFTQVLYILVEDYGWFKMDELS